MVITTTTVIMKHARDASIHVDDTEGEETPIQLHVGSITFHLSPRAASFLEHGLGFALQSLKEKLED